MIFGEGISRLGEIITMGEELGFIKKSGAWYSYNGERLGQGKEKTKKFLKENDDLRLEIEGKIKENMSKLDMSASEDGEGTDNADTSESAAENELMEIGDEASKGRRSRTCYSLPRKRVRQRRALLWRQTATSRSFRLRISADVIYG